MLITIITLYVDDSCEHYVGAVQGRMTTEEKRQCAHQNNAICSSEDDESSRQMFFREVECAGSLPTELLNMDGG